MNISPRKGPEKMFLEKVFYKLDVLWAKDHVHRKDVL
jgi:hypothetical protein